MERKLSKFEDCFWHGLNGWLNYEPSQKEIEAIYYRFENILKQKAILSRNKQIEKVKISDKDGDFINNKNHWYGSPLNDDDFISISKPGVKSRAYKGYIEAGISFPLDKKILQLEQAPETTQTIDFGEIQIKDAVPLKLAKAVVMPFRIYKVRNCFDKNVLSSIMEKHNCKLPIYERDEIEIWNT